MLSWAALSERGKVGLTWMVAVALIVVALMLSTFNEINYRRQDARNAVAQADILAGAVAGALAFDDRDAMREYVDALRVNPRVAAAAVYDPRGRALITYSRVAQTRPPPQAPAFGVWRAEGSVRVAEPVTENGTRLGAVYLATQPEGIGALLGRHGSFALLTLIAYALLSVLTRAGAQLQARADELADANSRLTVEMGERVRAEEALRQAQKMEALGQLTGGIAHDFNNLLQAMHGAFELIQRRSDQPERVKGYAAHGLQATERAASLTRQLLAFSRSQKLELKPFVVTDLVRDMRDLLVRTLGGAIRLSFKFDESHTAVLSDRTQLELAVLNLAINARDAMESGGELTISTRTRTIEAGHPVLAPDVYVELSVSDTGPGMPPEVTARAFDPFFTTKGVGKGAGLGLSQVYGVARQAGGEAQIESEPGKGTKVILLLRRSPMDAPAAETLVQPMRTNLAEQDQSITVLVVDDDDQVRGLVCDSLDLMGYRVVEAPDGPRALAALKETPPDVVLLDFAMPGMNGAEVATLARRERPDLPIVFASGYAETEAVHRALGEGAAILRKPFEMNELAHALREAMDASPGREKDTPAPLTSPAKPR